ncbi:MAG TPA: PLP-dependent aminotransferase family protein [Planktothrix sp.]|jgi:GntR family transcriptional regulator/MocR family aminotransferase
MDLLINLDQSSPAPMQKQLYEEFRRMILQSELKRGQRVPSTRELARSLGISRTTVTASYDYLLSEGYLESHTGSGTYVSRHLPEEMMRPAVPKELLEEEEPPGASVPFAEPELSWYGESLQQREWLSFAQEDPDIEFSFGRPDFDNFPMREWMQLINQHARKRSLSWLDYPSRAQGYLPLRQALSQYLIRSRGLHCTSEQIIVVNGSQQAIDLVCRVLIDRGDRAAIEEPGYLGAQRALLAQGAQLQPIPVDHNGLKVEELKRHAAVEPRRLKLVYVTPSHQFPTGVVMSLPRRLELLHWADRYGTYIIEDDYDSDYRFKGRPIPALAGLSHRDTVIYIGTFSKVLMPALRIGYLVVPARLIEVFSRAKWLADRHSPLLEQQALADFIRLGHLERHVRRMRSLYEGKRELVLATIKSLFGERARVLGDNAGINVLVRFNTTVPDVEIVERARSQGVGLTSTRQEYLTGGRRGEFLLNYGGLSEEKIARGLSVLASIVCHSDDVIVNRETPEGSEQP